MAVVFLRTGTSPWRQVEIPVSEYTMTCAAEREFGAAKLFIPRNHPILATDAIDEDGGTYVRILHGQMQSWFGIQEGPMDQGSDGWSLEASEIGILTKYHDVGRIAFLGPYTAGEIIGRSFRTVRASRINPLSVGSLVRTPPLVIDYDPTGLPFATVLANLADFTGQEWEIREEPSAGLVLNWRTAGGTLYEPLLVEGSTLVNVHRRPDTSTLVSRVRAENTQTGNYGEALAAELNDNPLGQTITIQSEQTATVALQQVAQVELEKRRYRRVRYQFGIRGHWTRTSATATAPDIGSGGGFPLMGGGFVLMGDGFPLMGGSGGGTPGEIETTYATWSAPAWSIRPGDYLRAVCPSVGKTGTTILARVMKITYGDGYAEPAFECQEVMPVNPAQLARRAYHGQRQVAQAQTVTRLLAQVAS